MQYHWRKKWNIGKIIWSRWNSKRAQRRKFPARTYAVLVLTTLIGWKIFLISQLNCFKMSFALNHTKMFSVELNLDFEWYKHSWHLISEVISSLGSLPPKRLIHTVSVTRASASNACDLCWRTRKIRKNPNKQKKIVARKKTAVDCGCVNEP